ncbi:hypothetical protein REO35_04225 [Clostridium perfringens]|uniref:hypothetical protein n=1 Tax=Clostridium perfringens TaxID=1502 RepID=UPI0028CD5D0B|nr:hypothetical protein [Clostridium perfringens]MDK0669364.1 hypothetical protein [Clostridium perfringens]MDT7986913.1 hypothetical protein [Clostridium perfringens]
MKVGFRKPNLKKSFKARTTGRMKRRLKRSINPLYGKKGMGYINNPKKAVYNKIYNKATIGASLGDFERSTGVYKKGFFTNVLLLITFPLWIGFYIVYWLFKLVYLMFKGFYKSIKTTKFVKEQKEKC